MANTKETLKKHLNDVYTFDYLMELLHRYIYEYLLDDGFWDVDELSETLWDFLYDKLQENGTK